MRRELSRASIEVVAIQLVDCEIPLDYANSSSRATLWVLGPDGQIQRACESTLWNVNKEAAPLDRSLARRIEGSGEGGVDGLICISTDVQGVNREAILAATASGKPIVGTGETPFGSSPPSGHVTILKHVVKHPLAMLHPLSWCCRWDVAGGRGIAGGTGDRQQWGLRGDHHPVQSRVLRRQPGRLLEARLQPLAPPAKCHWVDVGVSPCLYRCHARALGTPGYVYVPLPIPSGDSLSLRASAV